MALTCTNVRFRRLAALVLVLCLVAAAPAHGRAMRGWERQAGLDRVLKSTTVRPGLKIALGCEREPKWTTLLLVGASRSDRHAPWTPVLRELIYQYDVCKTCDTAVASELIASSRALVAVCFTGGSNGVTHVIVAGERGGRPALLSEFSCGQTIFDLDGGALVIESTGPRGGAANPGDPHPTIALTWNGLELVGERATDAATFDRFCQRGELYDLDE